VVSHPCAAVHHPRNQDVFNALEKRDISLVSWFALLFIPPAIAAVAFNVAPVCVS
jgi:hypothetical protein